VVTHYFLQASASTSGIGPASPITLEDVEVGLRYARRSSTTASTAPDGSARRPAQRALLRALATEGGDEPSRCRARHGHRRKRTTDLSVARNELIKKGLVYRRRGLHRLHRPGMGEFILRQE